AERPAPPAAGGLEPPPRMATSAPAAQPQPSPRVAVPAASAAPAQPAAPPPVILGGLSGGSPAARAGSGAEQGEPTQAGEHAAQDEAAQWWVSAWARWTSWKGTLSFADA